MAAMNRELSNGDTVNIFTHSLAKHLCLFCYKNIKHPDTNHKDSQNARIISIDNKGIIKKFIRLLEKLLGNENSLLFSYFLKNDNLIGCCKDCVVTVQAFCELFHQLQLIELKIQWKLKTLMSVMKLANRVPSRLKHLQRVFEELKEKKEGSGENEKNNDIAQGTLRDFRNCRIDLIGKCTQKLAKSQPRVLVKRMESNTGETPTLNEFDCHEYKFTPTYLISPCSGGFEVLFGWVMSFVAVALLASQNAQENLSKSTDFSSVIPNEHDISLNLEESLSHEQLVAETVAEDVDQKLQIVPMSKKVIAKIVRKHSLEPRQPLISKFVKRAVDRDSEIDITQNKKPKSSTNRSVRSRNMTSIKKDAKTNLKKLKESIIAARNRKNAAEPDYFFCRLDGCRGLPMERKQYEEHKKLHVFGSYNCKFCTVVEKTAIKLYIHETTVHSRGTKSEKDMQLFKCAKCPNQTTDFSVFVMHFAHVHLTSKMFQSGR